MDLREVYDLDSKEVYEMDAAEYKKYHESFMQDNQGSDPAHVFLCIFFSVQCSLLSSFKIRRMYSQRYFDEYLHIVLPLICAHTNLAEYLNVLNALVFFLLNYKIVATTDFNKVKVKLNEKNKLKNNKINSITVLRGLTYLITVFCILAVDFGDFPRYLAKTERYGYSLMDTGVGLFVLMSGLVHKDLSNYSCLDIIKGNLKFIVILIFLGIARIFFIKQFEYPEHITEYGVHWNFFFTLAVCKILSTALLYKTKSSYLLSFIVLGIHESLLFYGLEDWVFSGASRNSFISANREGISSCLGYVSMYLFTAHLKKLLGNQMIKRRHLIRKLMIGSIILSVLCYISHEYRPTSRVLANASYCIFLETVLVSMILIVYSLEVIQLDDKLDFNVPLILQSINANGLSYFLVANLLTGAVNLSMRTLLTSSVVSFTILNLYMMITIAFVTYM